MRRKQIEVLAVMQFVSLGDTRGSPPVFPAEPAVTQLRDSELWKLWKKGKVFIPSILKKKKDTLH